MDLWIRSQSKQTLMKASKVYNQEEEIFATGYTEFDVRIGVYKTHERAIEVLDEIQQLLIEYYQSIDYKIVPVYEMPKE